ncbi:MAG: tRNA (guanosine(46)-N7)-methyltransferase TrmB [Alphaproteobacteria bacterium]|nr:tRNA (guanosine(46)-N7)-methyltransferase TrmB [Alphaproteobacteria bacterium]
MSSSAPSEKAGPPRAQGPRRKLYGRRVGHRLRDHQQELMAQLLPRLAVSPDVARDPAALFPQASEFWLEVGSGGGEHAAAQAAVNPGVGLIACEPFINGIAKLLSQIEAQGLANIRIHQGDARDIIDALPDACIARAFVLFPDPWPKKRHWKRRFFARENLAALARVMAQRAELRLATDKRDYADWALEEVAAEGSFAAAAQTMTRPLSWPPTRYETKARAAGRDCTYLSFLRRP